jgi:hypothetical protein
MDRQTMSAHCADSAVQCRAQHGVDTVDKDRPRPGISVIGARLSELVGRR